MLQEIIKLFDYLIKLVEKLGLEQQTTQLIVVTIFSLIISISFLKILWSAVLYVVLKINQRTLNKDLTPFYSKSDVERATKYYIPTKYQNVSPSEDDEPGKKYIAAAKNKIIPLFLKDVFRNGASDNKYYLILADTGMGKTTFMINLYIRYKNKMKLFGPPKLKIYLLPLGDPTTLEYAEKIADKGNAILLLDAFDEDIEAIDRHKERLLEILKKINAFKYIVITCRTQFFPSEEEEPSSTGYFSFGDQSREYKFQKLYLSVFDQKSIKKYLLMKFHFTVSSKYKKALKIVENCPNLVVRPMLLSKIDELINSDKIYEYSFQIYESLIENWIQREANKPAIIKKYGTSDEYATLLYEFSYSLAYDLYKNRKERGGYFINKTDTINLSDIQLSDIEANYYLTDSEIKSKSLLNRSSKGQYKFSHKSIFEYFLAKKLHKDFDFYKNFDFDGMDATRFFFNEISIHYFNSIDATYRVHIANLIHEKTNIKSADLMYIEKILINSQFSFKLEKFTTLQKLRAIYLSPMITDYTFLREVLSLYDLYNTCVSLSETGNTSRSLTYNQMSYFSIKNIFDESIRIVKEKKTIDFNKFKSIKTFLSISEIFVNSHSFGKKIHNDQIKKVQSGEFTTIDINTDLIATVNFEQFLQICINKNIEIFNHSLLTREMDYCSEVCDMLIDLFKIRPDIAVYFNHIPFGIDYQRTIS